MGGGMFGEESYDMGRVCLSGCYSFFFFLTQRDRGLEYVCACQHRDVHQSVKWSGEMKWPQCYVIVATVSTSTTHSTFFPWHSEVTKSPATWNKKKSDIPKDDWRPWTNNLTYVHLIHSLNKSTATNPVYWPNLLIIKATVVAPGREKHCFPKRY